MQTFLVIGPFVWGKGNTPNEARRIAARQMTNGRPMRSYMVFLVGPSSYIDQMGRICTAADEQDPIELYRVENRKQIPVPDPATV
jgi:hypothetical protein